MLLSQLVSAWGSQEYPQESRTASVPKGRFVEIPLEMRGQRMMVESA